MRLSSVRIQNLRSCCDVEVSFNDYTCLVGANGAGKSNILCALNIFFRQAENTSVDPNALVAEDFHNKNTAKPVTITVTFTDLDPEAQQDFADYVRQGKLVISSVATFDPHRKSVRALLDAGFVLLLGEPACAKSTIAASLALGAIDLWGCSTIKIRNPEEFVRHWNPHEPKQFFWVDDAFGSTQYQWDLAVGWNNALPHLKAAIRKGVLPRPAIRG